MGVFVLGLLFVAIVGNTYTQQALYDDDLVTRVVPIVFQFIPPFNLAKAMADINTAASDYDTAGLPKNVTSIYSLLSFLLSFFFSFPFITSEKSFNNKKDTLGIDFTLKVVFQRMKMGRFIANHFHPQFMHFII